MNVKRSLLAAALLSGMTSMAFAAVSYKITDLGTLGANSSMAYGINNVGDIVGRSRPLNADGSNGTRSAFLYTNNQMLDLGSFGGSNTVGRASNFSRQVVGYSRPTGEREYKAFLYENGEMKNLGTLGTGLYSYAYSINDAGTVVGHSHTNASGTTSQAFTYKNGTMTGIGTLGGQSSGAFDINQGGVIVGSSTTADSETHGFIYQNGVMTSLGSLDGTGFSEARAINEKKQVVGNSLTANGHYHAFLYEDGVMADLGSIEGDSFAYDINMKGEIVGSYRSHLLESAGTAYYYYDGEMKNLSSMLSPGDQALWEHLVTAYGINDKGQIVGRGIINGNTHAYLMTPVPLPASILFLAPALGLLGVIRKRQQTV